MQAQCHVACALFICGGLLGPPMKGQTQTTTPDKSNTAEASIDGVAVLIAKVPQKSLAGDRLMLSLELRNSGKNTLVFRDVVYAAFTMQVRTQDGNAVPHTLFGARLAKAEDKQGRKVHIQLAPGEKATVTVNIGRLFDLSERGQYCISIDANVTIMDTPIGLVIEKLAFGIENNPLSNLKKY